MGATMLKFLVTEILMELVHVLAEESKQGGLRTGLPLSLKYPSLIPRPQSRVGSKVALIKSGPFKFSWPRNEMKKLGPPMSVNLGWENGEEEEVEEKKK